MLLYPVSVDTVVVYVTLRPQCLNGGDTLDWTWTWLWQYSENQSRVYVSAIQFDTYSITRGWSAKVLFSVSNPLVSAEEGRIEHALGNTWSQKRRKKKKKALHRENQWAGQIRLNRCPSVNSYEQKFNWIFSEMQQFDEAFLFGFCLL